jgi:hypothetical protein
MNVTIVSQEFIDGSKAVAWMKEQYAEYPDDSIVSSFMTKDKDWNTCYIVIDQAKLRPTKNKLIKIT